MYPPNESIIIIYPQFYWYASEEALNLYLNNHPSLINEPNPKSKVIIDKISFIFADCCMTRSETVVMIRMIVENQGFSNPLLEIAVENIFDAITDGVMNNFNGPPLVFMLPPPKEKSLKKRFISLLNQKH